MKANDLYQTPEWVYRPLGHFDLDPCAGENTNIADINYWDGHGRDGLTEEWFGLVFCNPPFSQKEEWAERMIKHNKGILLLPERGSAPWFGEIAIKSQYHFIMGKKIDFIGSPSSNNIGSVMFLFGGEAVHRVVVSGLPGHLNKTIKFNRRK